MGLRARQAAFVLAEMHCLFHAAQHLAIIAQLVFLHQHSLFPYHPCHLQVPFPGLSFGHSMTLRICACVDKKIIHLSNSRLQELSLLLGILAQLGSSVLAGRQHQVRARAQQAAIAK